LNSSALNADILGFFYEEATYEATESCTYACLSEYTRT